MGITVATTRSPTTTRAVQQALRVAIRVALARQQPRAMVDKPRAVTQTRQAPQEERRLAMVDRRRRAQVRATQLQTRAPQAPTELRPHRGRALLQGRRPPTPQPPDRGAGRQMTSTSIPKVSLCNL